MDLIDKRVLKIISENNMFNVESQDIILNNLKELVVYLINNDSFIIPMIPQVTRELLSIIDKRDLSISELVSIIEKDQFLLGMLLKVANSPVYAGSYPITKIKDSIMRLGLNEVRKILFTISMSTYQLRKGEYVDIFKKLWEHSIATAVSAQEISRLLKIESSYAYIAAMMHDIGKNFVLIAIVEMEKALKMPGFFGLDIVNTVIQDLHVKLGGFVAKKWNLPDIITDSILYHHKVTEAREKSEIALIVYCSDKLSGFLGYGDENSISPINEAGFYYLGMDQTSIESLIETVPGIYEKFMEGMSGST